MPVIRPLPLTALALAFSITTPFAAATTPTYGAVDGGSSVLLSNADGANPYRSVVRYLGRAQCTGVLIQLAIDLTRADPPAYVLTNGHCPDFPGSNDVLIDRPAPSSHRVIFNYFADTTAQQLTVPVSRIAYATMKGQDIAVLELSARYREIVRRGFEPWPITLAPPADDEPVVTVGAPLTSNPATSFLRLAACSLEDRADVVLEYIWHWFDFDRHRCQDVMGGSSGSPVISRRTGEVVGLVNTTTIGAAEYTDCFLNSPCEPSEDGATALSATSYVTPVVRIDRCFDLLGRFIISREGCPLDRNVQVTLSPSYLGAINPAQTAPVLGAPQTRWHVTVAGAVDEYRYRVVDAAAGDCRDSRGYGRAWRPADRPVIDDALPQREGNYFLCVLGRAAGNGWQRLEHPTIVAVRIDMTPPRIPARITIAESQTSWLVTFGTVEPEIATYTYKFGRPSETRCDDPAGYNRQLIPFISIAKANRPYVFCAIPHDSALNPGVPFEAILP